ncbi:flagellar assembly protein FliW [Desulfovibrio inopinatus]|uniref:flagellar assembly protein FliW n=1 Tax=Desulfovibrio inopinatus TaxID=102109 RepID=UPI000482145A|nr:flagellar assembly protein FliW [Desulfovibrio inopinatus]
MAKEKERRIQSRVGELSVPEDRIITFPRGLIGFSAYREFTLVNFQEDSPFMILQSMDDARLGILVADPYAFMTQYEIVVGDMERRLLKLDDMEKMAVLVTVTIPKGKPEETTLNLSGPIVINFEPRIGMQIPQTDPRFPAHFKPGTVATAENA